MLVARVHGDVLRAQGGAQPAGEAGFDEDQFGAGARNQGRRALELHVESFDPGAAGAPRPDRGGRRLRMAAPVREGRERRGTLRIGDEERQHPVVGGSAGREARQPDVRDRVLQAGLDREDLEQDAVGSDRLALRQRDRAERRAVP